ncbi:hypothetical protein [Desulfosudis oleivorans]|uniref:hypothetical protein n=1 Tax=Desulfosudis oleivorans TaxID=181663 RepID=UPI001294854B|nr:hypothetical protein [Desulfosudis oleivorans]
MNVYVGIGKTCVAVKRGLTRAAIKHRIQVYHGQHAKRKNRALLMTYSSGGNI